MAAAAFTSYAMPANGDPTMMDHAIDYDYNTTPRSDVSTPSRYRGSVRLPAEEAFHKNLVGMLNKRGYNVCDSGTFSLIGNETSETSTSSVSSSTSSMSSMIIGLREPNHGQGPLHIAVRKGNLQVLEALLENDCVDELINMDDNNGNTALHFAAGSWRRPQCATMVVGLLRAGADVRLKNKRDLPPLAVHMLTIKVDNATVVAQLLEYGADPQIEVDGESLLHIAIKRDLPAICGALVAYGASLIALNNEGLMCYEVAPQRIKRVMLRNIRAAPQFLPAHQRSKCMRCHGPLLGTSKIVGNFFKKLVGGKVSTHQCNCYHCGLLFCTQCLKRTQVADALHAQFSRSRLDDLSSVKTCPYCEAVLTERLQRIRAKETLERLDSRSTFNSTRAA